MISVIQRVNSASVMTNRCILGNIGQGILALIAVEKHDNEQNTVRLLERILNYRIFPDVNDRMNLSLRDIQGGLLMVPQFTLAADTRKGNRPSFSGAADPDYATKLFNYLKTQAILQHPQVAFGEFGADMQVSLVNDGPVTFILSA